MDKFGLNQNTVAKILALFSKQKGIEKIILYGSRAKGNYRKGSDIDLCLIAPSWHTEQLLTLENNLDDLLLPYKIDMVLYHQIDNKDLLDHIDRVGKVLYP